MNHRNRTLLLALALAVILVGAGIGYRRLAPGNQPQVTPLPAQMTEQAEEPASEQAASEPAAEPASEQAASEQAPGDTGEGAGTMTAPNFTVQDADGNTVDFQDLLDRPVIVNFWATWCPPCRQELPEFQAAYETWGEQVRFLMVNLTDGSQDTTESVAAFVAENGYTFPVYCDTQFSAVNAYGITSIPVTVAVAPDGTLVWGQVGAIDGETLEQVIQTLLDTTQSE